MTNQIDVNEPVLPTQQFGVTLEFIKENYQVTIPPVVKQCVEYLEQPDGKQNQLLYYYNKTIYFFFSSPCSN